MYQIIINHHPYKHSNASHHPYKQINASHHPRSHQHYLQNAMLSQLASVRKITLNLLPVPLTLSLNPS